MIGLVFMMFGWVFVLGTLLSVLLVEDRTLPPGWWVLPAGLIWLGLLLMVLL